MLSKKIIKLSLLISSSIVALGGAGFMITEKSVFNHKHQSEKTADSETIIATNIDTTNKHHQHTHQLGFTSLKKESSNVVLLIQDSIPDWLKGSFITIGPSIFELNNSSANHWLDGFGMIHQFTINKNAILYSNKLINSFYYQDCCAKGKLRGSAPEQKKSTWSKLTSALGASKRPIYDNTNINIACYDNQLVSLTETPTPLAIDDKTLQTKGKFTFNDSLEAHFASAHPLFDATTQEWFGIAIQYAHTSNYIIYSMKVGTNKRIPIATIPVGYPAYMHSFGLTKNYIILTETPFTVSPYDLLLSDTSFIETFSWQPKTGTNFIVIDRKTGKKIGSYKTESFFTLHHVNAFEKDDNIIIDLIAYKDPEIITKAFNYKNLCKPHAQLPSAQLKRFTIDLIAKKVSDASLSHHAVELPQINSSKLMHEYRFLYAAASEHGMANQLIKLDLHSNRHSFWRSNGCYPTEPVFVANPNGKDEDDGVILALVLNAEAQKSFLLILNAKTFTEIARAYVSHHIPFTIHSKFFPVNNLIKPT